MRGSRKFTDDKTTINELKQMVKEFCEERDWDQFHGAKNLATAMIIEAAELLEHFRWKSEKEVEELLTDPKKKELISEEIADVFYFLIRLAQKYNIDLSEALENKMKKNKEKYPVEKFRGSNRKYNEV